MARPKAAQSQDQPVAPRRALLTGGAVGLAAVAGAAALGRPQPAAAATTPSITDWINVQDNGAVGDGATDDTNAINTCLANAAGPNGLQTNAVVYLPPGGYVTSAPLIVPHGVTLRGPTPMTHSGDGQTRDWGATILPAGGSTPAWTSGSPVNAVISLTASGTTALARTTVESVWIDGRGLAAITPAPPPIVDGIAGYAGVQNMAIRWVGVFSVTGNGIAGYNDGSGNFPDGWIIEDSVIQSCGIAATPGTSGYGVVFAGADSFMSNVHAQGNTNDGFKITAGNNRLVACRADQSVNGSGFTIDVRQNGRFTGSTTLIGCGTEQNTQNGLNVINSSTLPGALSIPVIASGCSFDGDGVNRVNGVAQGGGGFAGISVTGANIVILTGCNVNVTTVDVSAGSPEFALNVENNGTSDPNLVQAVGGFWTAANTTGLVNGSPASTVLSYTVHGFFGGQFKHGDTITPYPHNPL